MNKKNRIPRGIVEPVVGGILILAISIGALYVLLSNKKTQNRSIQAESSNDMVAKKLETLMNAVWTDCAIKQTPITSCPQRWGLLTWSVTDISGRLKKITVRSYIANQVERALAENNGSGNGPPPTSNPTVTMIGYKFDDF